MGNSDYSYVYGQHSALQRYAEGTATSAPLDVFGGQRMSQHLPPMYELLKAGRVYAATTGVVADGLAPVQDLPTTGAFAGVGLYNGNAAGLGGLALVVLGVAATLQSGTPAVHSTLYGGVGQSAAALATTSGNRLKSLSGSSRTTAATLKSTPTLGTVGLTSAVQLATYDFVALTAGIIGGGPGIFAPAGLAIVPSGWTYGAYVLASAGTTPLFGFSIVYAEVESYLV